MINLYQGDCLDQLKLVPDCSVDSVVTDPPYGLAFMGKKWDYDVPSVEIWKECLRVLKPGGHLLSFGGTRTYHRMVINIEDAGFEIRDQIMWIYGSGFPKSMDISKAIDKQAGAIREKEKCGSLGSSSSFADDKWTQENSGMRVVDNPITNEAKQWQGWGTALKPANEPICLARKPISEKTVASNVLKHGTGAMNIDESRIGTDDKLVRPEISRTDNIAYGKGLGVGVQDEPQGRWPANVIFDEEAGKVLDEQSGHLKSGSHKPVDTEKKNKVFGKYNQANINEFAANEGGASRFFYCAKASKAERNAGLDSAELAWENDSWEKLGLNLLMENINSLEKDTLDIISKEGSSWSTDLYGHSISELYPKDMIFTIETILSMITELRTLNASQSSNIKDCIQDAIKTIEKNGLSLVKSAEFISQLNLNTISERMELVLGAVRVVLPMLLKIRDSAKSQNFHSTVKPTKLMSYLIKLITPPNGIVLDPFMGSGSTGVACVNLSRKFIGIEKDGEYFEIAKNRINL